MSVVYWNGSNLFTPGRRPPFRISAFWRILTPGIYCHIVSELKKWLKLATGSFQKIKFVLLLPAWDGFRNCKARLQDPDLIIVLALIHRRLLPPQYHILLLDLQPDPEQ